jgi:predicted regulator of Ras-like GTPase activity (Roadblock/LC7/MglB family)
MPNTLNVLWQDGPATLWDPPFVRDADATRQSGALDTARDIAEHGIAAEPLAPQGHAVLARICLEMGDVQAARAAWETTLRLDPHHRGALRGLAYLACQRLDLASALRFAEAARLTSTGEDAGDSDVALIREHFADPAYRGDRSDARTAPRGMSAIPDLPGPDARGETPERLVAVFVADEAGLVVRALDGSVAPAPLLATASAVLSELGAEATHVADALGLGSWRELLVDGDGGAVALGPAGDGLTVMVCGDAHAPLGSVRFALTRGRASLARQEER